MSETSGETEFVDFKCPACHRPISFPEHRVGTLQDCPLCMELVIVPQRGEEFGRRLPIPIQTPRLLLRRLVGADRDDLLGVLSDEGLFEYVDGTPLDDVSVDAWITRDRAAPLSRQGGRLSLGIELTAVGRLVGYVAIYSLQETDDHAGLMIMIDRQFQRQGYGSEAVRAVAGFVLTGINFHRLTVGCGTRNAAGCRMLEKAGLRREGVFLEDQFIKGQWVSTAWYALLKREFEESRPPVAQPGIHERNRPVRV